MTARKKGFSVRLTEQELVNLHSAADWNDLTVAEYLRRAVRKTLLAKANYERDYGNIATLPDELMMP